MWEDNLYYQDKKYDFDNIKDILKPKKKYILIGASGNWEENIKKLNLENIQEYENSKTILFERA